MMRFQLAGAIESLKNVTITDPVKKGALAKKIIEGLGGSSAAGSWNAVIITR